MTKFTRHRQRGQGLVEFALIFPVLILVLFGLIDLGRAVYDFNTLASASRQGVRIAIVNQNGAGAGCVGAGSSTPDTTKLSAHDCAVAAAIAVGNVTVSVTYMDPTDTTTCSPVAVGCLAEVTTTYQFQAITPIISSLLGSIAMSSTSKEPVEFVCPISAAACVPGT